MAKLIITDKLTPRIRHKLYIYSGIVYQHFIHPSLEIIEEMTTDFVPRNSDPPADPGKFASGTLQAGFYDSTLHSSLRHSEGVFGYMAYDVEKGELYAGEQHDREDFYHPKRYPGHKPQFGYLSIGMEVSKGAVRQNLHQRYMRFLKKM